ncbi:MAG: DinB family protein [Phycisphaerales bacterium]
MHAVLHSFSYALDFLREQVAAVDDRAMTALPAGVANHPAWVIGHLVYANEMLAAVIGVEPWLPEEWARMFGTGSVPVADPSAYPSKTELLAQLREVESRLTAQAETLSESALDAPFPDPAYLAVFPTVRHGLTQILVGHTAYHIAQVSAWRRAMGLPPLGRSFE